MEVNRIKREVFPEEIQILRFLLIEKVALKKFHLWIKIFGTPRLNIYRLCVCVTLGEILNLCEQIFSSEDVDGNCIVPRN